jgi:hypothetical protein
MKANQQGQNKWIPDDDPMGSKHVGLLNIVKVFLKCFMCF